MAEAKEPAAGSFMDLSNEVEAELRRVLEARSMPLYEMMSYHLGWRGAGAPRRVDRAHGISCLASCRASGGGTGMALPAAAAVELVENFTQIHDDIEAGRPTRNGRDAVWWVWGPAQAINAGDGMHALARLAMLRLGDRGVSADVTFKALQYLDEAGLALCEGRFADLEAQERIDLTVDGYLVMAAAKAGALLACACKLGALIAGADGEVVAAHGAFGAKLGVAIQVLEDIRQLWGADDDAAPSAEVLNKKKLLPIVYALQQADARDKRRLGEVFMKRVLEPPDVTVVRAVLDDLGARRHCEALAEAHRAEALEVLTAQDIPSQPLDELASHLLKPAGPN